ncbi:MAG: helix-turn-helix transcriptional regulator [Saprospiraceae bacterium]|nr:helix-turn-helix transcriptional regulator [Saprospiraceae bacterium]
MELINEFIYINYSKNENVSETSSIAKEDQDYLYLIYSLFDNDCLFDFSSTSNQIEIRISKTYFEKYEQSFDLVIEKQNICCNTQSKLFELLDCKLHGISRKVYMESIVLYLLFQIQKNNLVFQLQCDTCTIVNRPVESEKIKKAKDFIVSNLDQNITIPVVANFVGTNQCYLKKGFKEVTGQTIFEFLQENRMVKARFLLRTTSTSIQDIASIVGYASLSSFSQTYKNYFGLTPSMEKNQIILNN